MRLFGLEITRSKALSMVGAGSGGWWPLAREPFSGAWQHNLEIRKDSVLAFHADFACRTLIAGDVSKLEPGLKQGDANDIWTPIDNPAYSPFLRKPNDFQNRIQFYESWVLSKLQAGNTLMLKQRDGRGVVTKGYILDWSRVTPLVADDGSVFYQLATDKIAGLPNDVIVPAREVIHDRFNCMFHPLIGISPIYANGLAATQGLNIQTESATLFKNNSMPGGLLVAPTPITKDDAEKIKGQWELSFGGANRGRVGVIGNGVKFEKLPFSAVEGQMIEQLKWTAEVVCSTYHVPAFMVGAAPMPPQTSIEALLTLYYSQCVQKHIEQIELCLKEGLGLPDNLRVKFDLDGLLRMDTSTQYKAISDGIRGGFLTPNEGRWKLDKKPLDGGDTVYLQEQDHSLAALAARDAGPDPFGKASKTPAAPTPAETQAANDNATAAAAKEAMIEILKGFR
jgi:HK97 family phage portal protein